MDKMKDKLCYDKYIDLRNMYGHGTQPFGNEDIHHSNYIRFLKLFVLMA
mgnify:CR=1 FL=1